jgi:hypothetical protein
MFRINLFLAAISFPLLCAGCGEDTAPPSGLGTEDQLRPAARVSASAVEQFHFQVRQLAAEAQFSSSAGCVVTFVYVFGAENAVKEGPGKRTTGPVAFVSLVEINFCTQEILRDVSGETIGDVVFQADRTKLTEARLQATITAVDNFSGAEVPVGVDVTWTGTGELVSQSARSRTKTPTLLTSFSFKGTLRDATASATLLVDGENLATGDSDFADIFRARVGEFQIVRTTPSPPDTLP